MKTYQIPPVPKRQVVDLYRQAILSGVPTETVEEKISSFLLRAGVAHTVEEMTDAERLAAKRQQVPLAKRLFFICIPVFLFSLGLFLLSSAIWPIASYYLFTAPELNKTALVAPVPEDQIIQEMVPKVMVQAKTVDAQSSSQGKGSGLSSTNDSETTPDGSSAPLVMDTELDYTNLSNWFPNLTIPLVDQDQSTEYRLDVPEIDIQNAVVKLGGSNLDKSLIQYPGTALPGQVGSPVIFGHSVLRQFYYPSEKNPRRYLSIFSTIMTLKPGDKIFLTTGGIKYTYVVRTKIVVHPDDTSILEQRYDLKTIKLVTCVPEGTTAERGVVEGELVKTE